MSGRCISRAPACAVTAIPLTRPRRYLDIYGHGARLSGTWPGEIAGVSAVSIPVDVALAKIRERAIVPVWRRNPGGGPAVRHDRRSLFNRMVIHSLQGSAEHFPAGPCGARRNWNCFNQAAAKDEIDELTGAATVMSAHLSRARRLQLEAIRRKPGGHMVDGADPGPGTASEETLKRKGGRPEPGTENPQYVVAELTTASDQTGHCPAPDPRPRCWPWCPPRGRPFTCCKDAPTRLELEWKQNADKLKPNMRSG